MAKQKNYTDVSGTPHPQSYWLPVKFAWSKLDKTVQVLFWGFHEAATRQQKKEPIGYDVYEITPQEYESYLRALIPQGCTTIEDVVAKLAYTIAMNKVKKDPQSGQPLPKFFEGAQDV